MKRKVQILKRPKAQSGLEVKMSTAGMNSNQLSWPAMPGRFSAPDVKVKKVLPPTDRENATLEAEVGETILTNLQADGIPEFFIIGGKRHYAGGTPLNVPADSFIFSRDNSMKIKDESVQKMFGKSFKKSGYSPADLSKTYDINKFREILADPDSDDLQRKTAEMMITNYNLKLGALALAQESIKGFPQGIPKVAMPYLEISGLNPAEFVQTQGQRDDSGEADTAKYGGLPKHQVYGQTGYTGLQPWQLDQSGNTAATKSPEEVKTAEPGLNTSDPDWGMDYHAKRKSPVGFSLQAEPSAGKDFLINTISGLASGINNRKKQSWIDEHQGAQNLFNAQAGTKGGYGFDSNFNGLNFQLNNVGAISQQQGNMQGNAGEYHVKFGGGLPKAQTGLTMTEQIALLDKQKKDAQAMNAEGTPDQISAQKEKINRDNMQNLRDLYDQMKIQKDKGNLSSSWDWIPWTDDTAMELSEAFTKTASMYGYDSNNLQRQFEEENKPLKNPNANEILRTRINKKTGKVEQVNTAGKVIATIDMPAAKISSIPSKVDNATLIKKRHDDAVAAYEASKTTPTAAAKTSATTQTKTAAPKANNDIEKMTNAEIAKKIAELKSQE